MLHDSLEAQGACFSVLQMQSDSCFFFGFTQICTPQLLIHAATCAADLERELFILRKLIEKEKNEKMSDCKDDFYICTFSNNTIVYKVGAAVPFL